MSVKSLSMGSSSWFVNALITGSMVLVASDLHAFESFERPSLSDEVSLIDAIQKSKVSLDLRLRYEDARQNKVLEQGGQAATLNTSLSFQTQRYQQFSAFLKFTDVSALPDDDNYNSGNNGEFDDVLIGEPDRTKVSEAWLNYDLANTAIKYGRQSFSLNSGRLVGDENWYQSPQVFTGLTLANNSLNYTTITLSAFNRVEQPYSKYGDDGDSSLDVKMLSFDYSGFLLNNFSVYHLDISEHKQDPLWDSRTTGIHFSGMAGGNTGIADSHGNRYGEDFSISYILEFASQQDSGDNPLDYRANYHRIELGAGYQGGHFAIGQELLGADGEGRFVTPLADIHDHQGYAGQAVDQALGNVPGGIVDTTVKLSYRCSDEFSVRLSYHDYEFDESRGLGNSIGNEVEVSAAYRINDLRLLAKYADYSADQYGEDTRRIWLEAGINF